jgi:RNA polymerase sigma factor (sigma-70 family)
MPENSNSRTGTTLLLLLHDPANPLAWSAFVGRYGPRVYGWCRRWGLQEFDAENVTQDVLVKLVRTLRSFTYDPERGRFRAWLKTLTRRAWTDFLEEERRRGPGVGGSAALAQLYALEAQDDMLQSLEKAFDLELWDAAQQQVRQQVSPRDWNIFEQMTRDGRRAGELATQLGMQPTAVLMAKSRVKRKLSDAVRLLEQDDTNNPAGQS